MPETKTSPAPFDEKYTPFVTLGKTRWPIPELAPRQYTLIWEDIVALTRALDAASKDQFGERVLDLTGDQFARMQECVYVGLTRAHPDLTRDEFLDMACSTNDIVRGFMIVRAQTGLFGARKEPDGERVIGDGASKKKATKA